MAPSRYCCGFPMDEAQLVVHELGDPSIIITQKLVKVCRKCGHMEAN